MSGYDDDEDNLITIPGYTDEIIDEENVEDDDFKSEYYDLNVNTGLDDANEDEQEDDRDDVADEDEELTFDDMSGQESRNQTSNLVLSEKLANPKKAHATYLNMSEENEMLDEDDEAVDDGDEDDEDEEESPNGSNFDENAHHAIPDADLAAARKQREALLQIHRQRQQDIALLWHVFDGAGVNDRKQQLIQLAEAKSCTLHNFEYLQHLYISSLDSVSTLWTVFMQAKDDGDKKIKTLTRMIQKRDAKLNRLTLAYQTYIREVAINSTSTLTLGKNAAAKQIRTLESTESAIDAECHQSRLKFFHTKGMADILEDNLNKNIFNNGTSNSSNSHDNNSHDSKGDYVDREQCLTELSTLGEALEERTANLHKFHKKQSILVQIATQIKEKLAFIKEENDVLQQELDQLNTVANEQRSELNEEKGVRDQYKKNNTVLKKKQGFVRSDALVADFEAKRAELQMLSKELHQHKAEHARLMDAVEHHTRLQQQQSKHQKQSPGHSVNSPTGAFSGININANSSNMYSKSNAKTRVSRTSIK